MPRVNPDLQSPQRRRMLVAKRKIQDLINQGVPYNPSAVSQGTRNMGAVNENLRAMKTEKYDPEKARDYKRRASLIRAGVGHTARSPLGRDSMSEHKY